nr:epididymal-specific lipocalin-12 isoform X2 [Pan paniscus]
MTRGQHCDTWSYVLIPAAQPRQFTVDHGVEPGADREETRVVDSDYTQFALMLSRRHTSRLAVLRISLLGRSWLLPPGTLDQFICLGRAQGLSDDNIVFPDVTGNMAHLQACWAVGTGPAGMSLVDPRGAGPSVYPGSSAPACAQGFPGSWVPVLNPGSEPPPAAPGPLSWATSSHPRSPVPGHLLPLGPLSWATSSLHPSLLTRSLDSSQEVPWTSAACPGWQPQPDHSDSRGPQGLTLLVGGRGQPEPLLFLEGCPPCPSDSRLWSFTWA